MELKYNAYLRLGELEDLFKDLEEGLICGSFVAVDGVYNWLNNAVDYAKSLRAYIRATGDDVLLSTLKKINRNIYLQYAYESNTQLYNKLVYVHKLLLDICTEEEEQGKQEKQDITALAKILGDDICTPTPPPPPMTGTGGEPILLTLDMWRREQAHRATQEDRGTGQEDTGGAVKESLTDDGGKLLKLPVEGLSDRARNNLKPVEGELLRILNNGIREGYFSAGNGVIKYSIVFEDLAEIINGVHDGYRIPIKSIAELFGIDGEKVSRTAYKHRQNGCSKQIKERRLEQYKRLGI